MGEPLPGVSKEPHLLCGNPAGEVARVAPRRCGIVEHRATAASSARLAGLRWRKWGEPVAHATGVALIRESHKLTGIQINALSLVECDGVPYYEEVRVAGPRLHAIFANAAPC
jgi:hypothetical protein